MTDHRRLAAQIGCREGSCSTFTSCETSRAPRADPAAPPSDRRGSRAAAGRRSAPSSCSRRRAAMPSTPISCRPAATSGLIEALAPALGARPVGHDAARQLPLGARPSRSRLVRHLLAADPRRDPRAAAEHLAADGQRDRAVVQPRLGARHRRRRAAGQPARSRCCRSARWRFMPFPASGSGWC